MLHLAASEVKQRLGQYITCALTEPVVIEKSGRFRRIPDCLSGAGRGFASIGHRQTQ